MTKFRQYKMACLLNKEFRRKCYDTPLFIPLNSKVYFWNKADVNDKIIWHYKDDNVVDEIGIGTNPTVIECGNVGYSYSEDANGLYNHELTLTTSYDNIKPPSFDNLRLTMCFESCGRLYLIGVDCGLQCEIDGSMGTDGVTTLKISGTSVYPKLEVYNRHKILLDDETTVFKGTYQFESQYRMPNNGNLVETIAAYRTIGGLPLKKNGTIDYVGFVTAYKRNTIIPQGGTQFRGVEVGTFDNNSFVEGLSPIVKTLYNLKATMSGNIVTVSGGDWYVDKSDVLLSKMSGKSGEMTTVMTKTYVLDLYPRFANIEFRGTKDRDARAYIDNKELSVTYMYDPIHLDGSYKFVVITAVTEKNAALTDMEIPEWIQFYDSEDENGLHTMRFEILEGISEAQSGEIVLKFGQKTLRQTIEYNPR